MEQTGIPKIIHIDKTDSTNRYLRELLTEEKLPEGSVVVAGYQQAGRGQAGNSWESEPGQNLLFSTVLYPEYIPANRQFLISQIVSLSVKETLDLYTEEIRIKWPNDIYCQDKKICGILIENDLTGPSIYCSIAGIGININQEKFHSDAPNPVSLRQITGKVYNPDEILDQFLNRFYHWYLLLLQEKNDYICSTYQKSLYRNEGYHPFEDDNGPFKARIQEIEPTGHLILQLPDQSRRRYAFKEVEYKIPFDFSGREEI